MARPDEREKVRHEPRGVKAPERTCTGCRKQAHPRALVRLVALPDGRVALDPKASSGGRGAWVHPTRGCVEATVKRHAAERTLKLEARRDLDAGALLASLREALARKAASLLVVASRTRAIALGAEAVADALERGRVHLVVAARDAGQTAAALAEGAGPRVLRHATKMELGGVFGRGEVALLALTEPRIAAELAQTIERLAALED
ncbi:MAG: DUF448 domain-containing protein [Polyangiales bacterium]